MTPVRPPCPAPHATVPVSLALVLALASPGAHAQHAHHAGMSVPQLQSQDAAPEGPAETDHAAMDHGQAAEQSTVDHAAMQHMDPAVASSATPREPIPPVTPADIAAAFPDITAHAMRDNGRTVLSYAMLKSTFDDPDGRDPGRDVELHLTGHMEKFAWSFDGQKFSGAQPLRFNYGERLRIVLVNDTMMAHPIHLHGMWSDLEDEHGNFLVRKHTVDMPPGSRRSYRVRADALGRWAYHCHLLYHMEAGMMREVRVEP
jgi:FtsP/CotA-like multicopper oxidase with cupredoxin domain